jgi:hypothetical protein
MLLARKRGSTSLTSPDFKAQRSANENCCNQVEFFAQKREEETWAQLAARVPPTGFIGDAGTPGVSQIMMLTAQNTLRNTTSTPQIAAKVLRQILF